MNLILFAALIAVSLFILKQLGGLIKKPLDSLRAAWAKMPNGPKTLIAAGAIVLVVLVTYWYGSSVLQQEQESELAWMKIYRGCPQDSVLALLGPPTTVRGSSVNVIWNYGWLSSSYVAFDREWRVSYWRQ